jgi:hypothetical protein
MKEVDTMTNTSKMTQRTALLYAIENLSDAPADVLDKLNAMLVALDKKNSAERKPTAKQTENASIKAQILAGMEPDVQYTSADVAKSYEGLTVQRVSALLTQLVNDGALVKTVDKRKSFYSLA